MKIGSVWIEVPTVAGSCTVTVATATALAAGTCFPLLRPFEELGRRALRYRGRVADQPRGSWKCRSLVSLAARLFGTDADVPRRGCARSWYGADHVVVLAGIGELRPGWSVSAFLFHALVVCFDAGRDRLGGDRDRADDEERSARRRGDAGWSEWGRVCARSIATAMRISALVVRSRRSPRRARRRMLLPAGVAASKG